MGRVAIAFVVVVVVTGVAILLPLLGFPGVWYQRYLRLVGRNLGRKLGAGEHDQPYLGEPPATDQRPQEQKPPYPIWP